MFATFSCLKECNHSILAVLFLFFYCVVVIPAMFKFIIFYIESTEPEDGTDTRIAAEMGGTSLAQVRM